MLAMMAVGLAATVAGQIQAGQRAEAQAEQQAQIAEYNAAQKDIEAQQNLESAKIEEQRLARIAKLYRGEQVAKIGISGTEFSGSAIEALGDIAFTTRQDRDIVLRTGTIAGAQGRAEAYGSRIQAKWSRLYGRQAKSAAFMGAFGTGVKGAYSMYGMMPMGR